MTVLVAPVIAASVTAALTVTRTVNTDYHNLRTFYAAEPGIEHALAHHLQR